MTNRRDFLKTGVAAGTAAAAIDANALIATGAPKVPAELSGDHGFQFNLYGTDPDIGAALRSRLDTLAGAQGTTIRRLQINPLLHTPTPWMAEDIALLTRYTPAPDGVTLEFASPGPTPQLVKGFENYWSAGRNAVVIGMEPYAMLVNKSKARAAGVASHTLAAFAARGLRPRLPISLSLSTGDNGWIHPLFAEYTGWHKRPKLDIAGLFLDPAALEGMNRLRLVLQSQLDTAAVSSPDQAYSALLNQAEPEVAAVYGNPLLLASRLAAEGRLQADFEIVSLQEFMDLRVPSLFRAAALQVGSRIHRPEAAEIARVLVAPAGRKIIAPMLSSIASLGSGTLTNLPNDFGFYSRLPHLNMVADARVMTTLAINLRTPQDEPTKPGEVSVSVYRAASTAFYDLAGYASREETLYSVAKHAAPSIALA